MHRLRRRHHGDAQAGGFAVEVPGGDDGRAHGDGGDRSSVGLDAQHLGIAAGEAVLTHARAGVRRDLEHGGIVHAQQLCARQGEFAGGLDDLDRVLCGHAVVGGDGDGDAAGAQCGHAAGGADGGVTGAGALEAEPARHAVVGGDNYGFIHLFAHAQGDAGGGEGDGRGCGNDSDGLLCGYAVVGGGGDGAAALAPGDELAVGGDRCDAVIVDGEGDCAGGALVDAGREEELLAHAQHRRLTGEVHRLRRGHHGDGDAGGFAVEGTGGQLCRARANCAQLSVFDAQDAFVVDGIVDMVAVCIGGEADGEGGGVVHAQHGFADGELYALGGAADSDLTDGAQSIVRGYSDCGAAGAHAVECAGVLIHLHIAGAGAGPGQVGVATLGKDGAGQRIFQRFSLTDDDGSDVEGEEFRFGNGHRDADGCGRADALCGDGGAAGSDGGEAAIGGDLGDGGIGAAPGNAVVGTVGVACAERARRTGREHGTRVDGQAEQEFRVRIGQGIIANARRILREGQRCGFLVGEGGQRGCVRPAGAGKRTTGEADLRLRGFGVDFGDIDHAARYCRQGGGIRRDADPHGAGGCDAGVGSRGQRILGRPFICGHLALGRGNWLCGIVLRFAAGSSIVVGLVLRGIRGGACVLVARRLR